MGRQSDHCASSDCNYCRANHRAVLRAGQSASSSRALRSGVRAGPQRICLEAAGESAGRAAAGAATARRSRSPDRRRLAIARLPHPSPRRQARKGWGLDKNGVPHPSPRREARKGWGLQENGVHHPSPRREARKGWDLQKNGVPHPSPRRQARKGWGLNPASPTLLFHQVARNPPTPRALLLHQQIEIVGSVVFAPAVPGQRHRLEPFLVDFHAATGGPSRTERQTRTRNRP